MFIKRVVEMRANNFLKQNKLKRFISRITPSRSLNFRSKQNYKMLVDLLLREYKTPKVLVIGGRIFGKGIDVLVDNPLMTVLETDIQFGPRAKIICDAHSLPFDKQSFHAVVIQAVLEHVLEPGHCVDEVYRVLVNRGFVYAETPFMQQVHGYPYDFARYTYLGHRRLLRKFEEVDSGAVAGPGTALTWAWEYFLQSFSDRIMLKAVLRRLARFTGFWFKYFDYFLLAKKGSLDGASANYFLGRKSDEVLSDRELLAELLRKL